MEKSNEQVENVVVDSTEESKEEEIAEVVHIQDEGTDAGVRESEEHLEDATVKNSDQLIDEARDMVQQSDHASKDCLEILDRDIESFVDEKRRVLEGSVRKTEALLSEAGFDPSSVEDVGDEGVKFESEEPIVPVRVKPLSSGKFSAFIWGLIVGLAAVAAWIYVATENMKMTLDVSKIPEVEVIDQILLWIGGGITGGEGNALVGIVILAVSGLTAIWIVYTVKVFIRENSNDRLAQKVHKDAEFYCTKKEECKKEMEKISEHINKTIKSLHTYDIFFQELDAGLQRVIHLEGKVPFDTYHPKSKEDMKRANLLINSLGGLLSVPMAGDNGSLSKEANEALTKSNHSLELYRENLYA